jgi:hypothetical protein
MGEANYRMRGATEGMIGAVEGMRRVTKEMQTVIGRI